MLVKQSGRPAWLLVTIPLLAAGAVVAILAYGILYQGVDLKESEQVYTLLDQREHLADSVEVRSFFAGLAPTDGLRPGARSAVFPHHYYSSGNSSPVFVLDLRERPVLSGEFLPVRREGHHVVVSEQAARGRLSFERQDADRIACQNGLEVELASLLVADAEGELYAWMPAGGELLAPGQRVELARVLAADDLPLHTWMPAPIDGRDLGWSRDPFDRPQLPPSTYVARAGASIYADDTGLVPDVVTGEHVVLGVLPLAEEEWR